MALTVTTDLTVITNGNDGTWNDVGGGSGSGSEPDYFIQGTGCRSRAVSGAAASRGMTVDIGAGNTLDFSSGGTEEDMVIYFWIQDYTPGLTDNVATAPGLTIRIAEGTTNGSDYAEWDIIYSDLLSPPGTEFFRIYVLDPRCPPTRTSGTWDFTTCRHFGAVLDTNATAKGQNLGIDRISYGFGEIKVTGTATDAASGFREMVDENWNTVNDSVAIGSTGTARNGIFDVKGSTVFIKGKIVIGDDTGTLGTSFTGQDTSFEWLDTFYYDNNGMVRSSLGYNHSGDWTGRKLDGSAYYGLECVGNGTNDTDVIFGAIVGTDQGRSGPSFIGSELTPTEISFDDGSVEDMFVYGCTFDRIRKIDFASNAAADQLFSCTFKRCGALDIGPVEAKNNTFISCIGGGYEFYESFENKEASAAEQLSTANPSTEWTDLLNGAEWSVPSATARYVELTNANTRTNITHLDDDKMGSDDHYAECLVFCPSAGNNQGLFGLCIGLDAAAEDYFYLEFDRQSGTIELFRVNTGTDTSIAGPTTFNNDEDEFYVLHLRRSGTTIEGFMSGYSFSNGLHTTKISATDSAHTGTSHRRVGLRGDASTSQTGDAPRVSQFGAGPITDNLGAVVFPATGSLDFQDATFINCSRALSWDTTGAYTLTNVNLSGNLVDTHNDSGGSVTGSFVDASVPGGNAENLGASTSAFTADVLTKITVEDADGTLIENARVLIETADDGGGSGLPFEAAVTTLTQSLGTAVLTASAVHGLATNDYVTIRGAQPDGYNKVAQITVTSTTAFTYTVDSGISTPATGTPVFSYVAAYGLTNASGVVQGSKTWPVSQGLTGWTRKSSSAPYYRQTTINIADASGGTDLLVALQPDE